MTQKQKPESTDCRISIVCDKDILTAFKLCSKQAGRTVSGQIRVLMAGFIQACDNQISQKELFKGK